MKLPRGSTTATLVSRYRAPFDALHGLRVNPGVTRPNGLHVTGFEGEGGHP